MGNYTQREGRNQALLPYLPTFWLNFATNGDPTEWVTAGLPVPNIITFTNSGVVLGWQIDGYFGTKRGIEYLNDTIGKITIALRDTNPKRLPWKPDTKTADHYYPKIHRLKEFAVLLHSTTKNKAPARADSFSDHAFWAIKLYVEDLIREQGEGLPVVYEALEDWALSQFINKERSTIRAKCRSVWNWYNNRDWQLPKDKRKFEMTRRERAISNSQKRAEEAKRKIINATTGLMAQEYKKSSGKWNIAKLAKELGMSRNTVMKYLPEIVN